MISVVQLQPTLFLMLSLVSVSISGLSVQLDPIEANMMDRGSWYWDHKINGTHIELELKEL